MKVDPINILLNENFNLNNKFYFISGNEVSLIEKVYKTIIERYQKKEDVTKIELDTIDNFKYEETLGKQKYFLQEIVKGLKKI